MGEQVRTSRRQVVQAVTAAGVAAPLLAACGGDGDSGGGSGGNGSGGNGGGDQGVAAILCGCHGSRFSIEDGSVLNGPAASPLAPADISVAGDEISYEGSVLTNAADVPVGGGTVFNDQKVVVTQPQDGTFQAFTAVCTHQGCIVQEVKQA